MPSPDRAPARSGIAPGPTLAALRAQVGSGEVDTILCVFADIHGRLVGKRVTGDFFLDDIVGEGAMHACDYLLAVDLDMTPLPGYRFASWEQGYGDMRAVPDLATLRLLPWLERTALVICDLQTEEGAPIEVSPRRILQRQLERARALDYTVKAGCELEFYLFRESYETLADDGYRTLTPHSSYIEDYHILQTSRDEYLIREIRTGMQGAGVPVEFSKGECGRGQHEINLRYAGALEMADRHVIYKNGAKEIAAQHHRALSFMAKYTMADSGSSCHIHSSLWDSNGESSLTANGTDLSATFRHYLGGRMQSAAELSLLVAPNINSYKRYQPGSWAPTALAWGRDNRTCGFRVVGKNAALRVEDRTPGADCNPYLALAATIAGGLWGIENGIEPPGEFRGNAYTAEELPRVPASLHQAIALFEQSTLARFAFGDEVAEHLLNTARQELAIFDHQTVTDWELRRYLERI